MADNPRIDDLRKRLEKEPASRLFAQLAEELRKDGQLDEAIEVCRAGLTKHASYTSARMTLGRALMDTGDIGGAKGEFEAVVKAAPDNILASRLLGECLEGLGDLEGALKRYKTTLALAPGDKQVLAHVEEVEARLKAPASPPAAIAAAAVAAPAPPEVVVPIPLVAAEESFELEAPYASPMTVAGGGAVASAPATPEIEESFELEPGYAAPTPFLGGAAAAGPPVAPPVVAAAPPVVEAAPEPVAPPLEPEPAPEPTPEIASSTLAELYFNQGHTGKAIEVYRQLVEREPANERARARLTELVALERHLEAEEAAVVPGAAPLDPRAARRAAIERTIGRLEAMRATLRRE